WPPGPPFPPAPPCAMIDPAKMLSAVMNTDPPSPPSPPMDLDACANVEPAIEVALSVAVALMPPAPPAPPAVLIVPVESAVPAPRSTVLPYPPNPPVASARREDVAPYPRAFAVALPLAPPGPPAPPAVVMFPIERLVAAKISTEPP